MKKILIASVVLMGILFTGCFHKPTKSTFRLGMDPSFIPLNTMGQEAHLNGYVQDIFHKVGNELKDSIELIKLSWDDLLPQLKNDTLDGIITTLSPYNFYKKDFLFSDPLMLTGPALVCRKNELYKDIKNLSGKILGIIAGSNSEVIALSDTQSIVQSFESPTSMLDALAKGQLDAALLDYLIAYAYTSDLYQSNLVITTDPYGDFGIRLMTKKSNPKASELTEGLNAILKDHGDLKSLLKKYQLPDQF